MNSNLLVNETSPYLIQHAHNPVAWYPWGPKAFERAKRENKPILLSIGYSACHWCHVMAHESFEHEDIAQIMNENFINIKVDREERPDLDRYYQQALQLFGKHGGWPLTMFLTPTGKPFWGGTYFPPIASYHLPAFTDVLKKISEIYRTSFNDAVKIGQEIDDAIASQYRAPTAKNKHVLNLNACNQLAESILTYLDPIYGGLAGAPKFPEPNLFQFLWRAYERTHDTRFKDAVFLLLTQMSKGGIYDHLGGGYARYSTDRIWLVPHFEKMLYDNAQILELLTVAWQCNASPLFKQRVYETIAWVEREIRLPEGGFASALDADSEGEEGRFYVWSEKEIDALLGAEEATYFKHVYGVSRQGNWEGNNILNLLSAPNDIAEDEKIASAKKILFEARSKRTYPGRDDKVLTDWNGLMIKALTQASVVFEKSDWLVLAKGAFSFITQCCMHDNTLSHSWCKGRANNIGFLEDYASMSRAALALFQATGQTIYLEYAKAWVAIANKSYAAEDGGYFQTMHAQTNGLQTRLKETRDSAVPSGNGMMLEALVKLSLITDKPDYQARVEKMFATFTAQIIETPLAHVSMLNAYDVWERALQVTLAGKYEDPIKHRLLKLLHEKPFSNLVINHADSVDTRTNGKRACAVVCHNRTCSTPVYEEEKLASMLEEIWA